MAHVPGPEYLIANEPFFPAFHKGATAAASCPRRTGTSIRLAFIQCGSRYFKGNVGCEPDTTVVLAGQTEGDWPQWGRLDGPGQQDFIGSPDLREFRLLLGMAAKPQLCSMPRIFGLTPPRRTDGRDIGP